MKKRLHKALTVFLASLLIIMPFAGCTPSGSEAGGYDLSSFSVVPQSGSDGNMATDGSFLITCDNSFNTEDLQEIVRLEPQSEFTLEAKGGFLWFGGGGEYILTPTTPLEEGTLYNVVIGRDGVDELRRWAFQTALPAGVVNSDPIDGQEYIGLDRGLEFTMSHDGMDISEHFSIEPHVEGSFDNYGRVWVFMPSQLLEMDTLYTVTIAAGVQSSDPDVVMEEDYTVKFRTDMGSRLISAEVSGSQYETFLPGDPLVLPVRMDGYEMEAEIAIYRLPDGGAYIDALADFHDYRENELGYYGEYNFEDVADLEEVYRDIQTPVGDPRESKNGYSYLLPGQEPGWYVSQITLTPIPFDENVLEEMVDTSVYDMSPDEMLLSYGYSPDEIDGMTPEEIKEHVEPIMQDIQRMEQEVEMVREAEPVTYTKLLQIADYGVYSQYGESDGLVWINDTISGQGAQGLTVDVSTTADFAEKNTATTDENGIAQFTTYHGEEGEQLWHYTRLMRDGEVVYVDFSGNEDYVEHGYMRDDYVSMLYLDRPLYMPNDTVNFWGMIAPRPDTEAEMPKELWLNLTSWSYGEGVIKQVPITPDENGGFTGSIELEDVVSGYYSVYLAHKDGSTFDESYADRTLQIKRYTKPSYVTEVEKNALWYEPNDEVEFTISSNFFEGTPAAGQRYIMDIGNAHFDDIVTDSTGKATVNFEMGDMSSEMGYTPYARWYDVQLSGNEDYYSIISGSVLVIPRNVMVETTEELMEDGNYDVTLNATDIDTSLIEEDGEVWDYTWYNLAGEGVDIPLQADLYRFELVAEQTGEYYDYVNQVVRPLYTYTEQETLVETYNLVTQDGIATIEDVPADKEGDFYYELRITGRDFNDREFFYDEYIGSFTNQYRKESIEMGYKEYRMWDTRTNEMVWSLDMGDGEEKMLTLYENSLPMDFSGSLLSVMVRDGIMSAEVSTDGTHTVSMADAMIPWTNIYSAYFDGEHIYPVNLVEVRYAYEGRELEFDIATDKERYTPGEEVTATLSVTKDGQAVPDASYAISVVDEALFALVDQDYMAIGDLYKWVYPQQMRMNTSYMPYLGENLEANPDFGGGKGGGGGDGESRRMDFFDTAAFMSGITDSQGKAEVTFTLPDNLTSWRLTGVGYTPDHKQAGDTTYNIDAGLEFFVQPLLSDIYLVGDDITFTARGRTNPPANMNSTEYTAELMQGDTVLDTLQGTGELATFNFGQRVAGNYTMRITATHNGKTDTVLMDFTVKDSALERSVTTDIDITQPLDIEAVRYPVSISLYDANYEVYSDVLQALLASDGRRIDQRIGREWAITQLRESGEELPYYFDEQMQFDDPSDGYVTGGGLSLMPGGVVDWLLTGKAMAVMPELLSAQNVYNVAENMLYEGYMERYGENYEAEYPELTPDQRLGAYFTLAATGRPVLNDLRSLMDDPYYDWQQRAIIIAGLGLVGDMQGAQTAYNEDIAPLLVKENDWGYVVAEGENEQDTRDLSYEATTRALLAAAAIGHEDAHLLAKYLCDNPSDKSLANLELLLYARSFPPLSDAGGSVSYQKDGETHTVELAGRGVEYVTFVSAEELQSANFEVIEGDVGASAYYVTEADPTAIEPIEGVSITHRMYPEVGESGDTFSAGDIVYVNYTIEFDEFAPDGYYTFEDYIPSGARFVFDKYNSWGNHGRVATYYFQSSEEQKVVYGVNIDRENAPEDEYDEVITLELSYTMRCALPGEYVISQAYLTDTSSGRVALSDGGTITINEYPSGDPLAQVVSYSQSEG